MADKKNMMKIRIIEAADQLGVGGTELAMENFCRYLAGPKFARICSLVNWLYWQARNSLGGCLRLLIGPQWDR
jgi:hypothetical protein